MTVFLSALAIGLASVLLGAGLCCRWRWTWTAPAVGLAALMLIALVAVRLPGHGATAAGAAALALVLSAVSLARARVNLRPLLAALPVAAVVLAFCALPFIANGRVGELGASALDDIWFHMSQAEVLRTEGTSRQVLADGYPIGPHATVAALAEGTGTDVDAAFMGLLLAAPVLLSLVALAVFEGLPWPLRVLGAALVGTPYLLMSYLAEGAFKEPLLALFFLGFVLTLREAVGTGRIALRHFAALTLTAAGGVAAFGLTALAWPAGALAWLGLLEYGPRVRAGIRVPHVRMLLLGGVGFLAAVAVVVLAARSSGFFSSGPGRFIDDRGAGGNFVGQLSPLEAFGIWPNPDFRLGGRARWWLEPGVAVAATAVLVGTLWCWYRRERVLLAAALAGVTVYAAARPVTLAYFSGKALAVLAPILTLIAIRGLIGMALPLERPAWSRRAPAVAAVGLFAALAAYSSALALRAAHVRPHDRGPDLAAFRPLVHGEDLLYLGRDVYVGWDLRGPRIAGFQSAAGLTRLPEVPAKASFRSVPAAVDVDSPGPRGLDAYRFVVTSRTAYASMPPPNLEPIARTRWHVLWRRRGPTPVRSTLMEGEAPGAVLDCRRVESRTLTQKRGTAWVRPKPVVGGVDSWKHPDGSPARAGVTVNGRPLVQELQLGTGVWEVSLRYFSDVPLKVLIGSERRSLPAYLGDRSTYVAIGRVTGGGPVRVEVSPGARRRIDVVRTVLLGEVAATRVDDRGHQVPLRRACGRYVDWYRLDG